MSSSPDSESTGWAYVDVWTSNIECANDPVFSIGVPTNTCLNVQKDVSVEISCDSLSFVYPLPNNEKCRTDIRNNTDTPEGSAKLFCSSSPTINFLSYESIIINAYKGPVCANDVDAFAAIALDTCFQKDELCNKLTLPLVQELCYYIKHNITTDLNNPVLNQINSAKFECPNDDPIIIPYVQDHCASDISIGVPLHEGCQLSRFRNFSQEISCFFPTNTTATPFFRPTLPPVLPSYQPISFPSLPFPTFAPSSTNVPTRKPFDFHFPTVEPSIAAISVPTSTPTATPSSRPTATPTATPSSRPTSTPTSAPSLTSSPSLNPTLSPSNAPSVTILPTSSPTISPILVFNATQIIYGCSYADFESSENYPLAFDLAVSETMTGIYQYDVNVVSSSNISYSAISTRRNLQSIDSISINFTVQANYIDLGFSTSVEAYYSLSTQLINSVNSGNFTIYLNEAAVLYDAYGLEFATAGKVSTSEWITPQSISTQPSIQPTSSPNSVNDARIIVGVVLGLVAAVLVFGTVINIYLKNKKTVTVIEKPNNSEIVVVDRKSAFGTPVKSPISVGVEMDKVMRDSEGTRMK
eukprot:gene17910-23530_t